MDFYSNVKDPKLISTLKLLKIGEEIKLDFNTYFKVSEEKAFEICEKILKKHLELKQQKRKPPPPPPKGSKYSYLTKSQIEKNLALQEQELKELSIKEEDLKKIEAFQEKKLLCPLCSKKVYIEEEFASFSGCGGTQWLYTICSDLKCGIYLKYYCDGSD